MHTLWPKHNTHRYVDDKINVYLIESWQIEADSWRCSKPCSELMMPKYIDPDH